MKDEVLSVLAAAGSSQYEGAKCEVSRGGDISRLEAESVKCEYGRTAVRPYK